MFESKTLYGDDFLKLPAQEGIVMSQDLFESRFQQAIGKCISMQVGRPDGSAAGLEHRFTLEQCPYNGNQLFADEVVMSPNKGAWLGDAFSERNVLAKLWRFDRFPRYVHLGIEEHDQNEIRFVVQLSCCYCSVYDPDHPNPLFPIRVFGPISSIYRGEGQPS